MCWDLSWRGDSIPSDGRLIGVNRIMEFMDEESAARENCSPWWAALVLA
jgi:hypothetical protein